MPCRLTRAGWAVAWHGQGRTGQRAEAVSATAKIKHIEAKAKADHGWLSGWLPDCTILHRKPATSQPETDLE